MSKKDELDQARENVNMKELVAQCMDQLPQQIAFQQYLAKLQRARFEELVKEGFSEAQAVELCKDIIGS